jgi:tetratricopeptide (TPR) repeat protein
MNRTARFAPQTTTPEEQEENYVQIIIRTLELVNGFAVYFAVCNQRQHAFELMAQVEQAFPPSHILRVPLTEPQTHLISYVQNLVEKQESPPHTLFLYGMENWIAKDAVERTELVHNFNMTRNSMARDIPYALVFWLPEYLYHGMLIGAPDFCSIASGVYYLPAIHPNPSKTEQLTAGDYTGIFGLTLAERNQRIQNLTQLLADYRALSDPMRDYRAEARILKSLGELYFAQGRYEEAELLHKQALEMRQNSLPAGHPDIATSLNNLALLYRTQRRYEEAELLHKQALEIWQNSLPAGHPDIARSLNNLANLYDSQGRYAEAEPLFKKALEIRQNSLPKGHPDTAGSFNNLALFYYSQRQYSRAEPLLKQALDIWQTSLPQGHPYITMTLNNLALLYEAQGRIAEAEFLRKKSRENEA